MKPVAVLIGPPAAGKTKLGKRIAKNLGVEFIDTDKVVVKEHGPIPQIFAQHGEKQFREWERAAVAVALKSAGVVSLGGGAILNPETRIELEKHRVLLITAKPEVIRWRLVAGKRPLLTNGIESWKELVKERQPIYDSIADMTVDTSSGTMESIAKRVAGELRKA